MVSASAAPAAAQSQDSLRSVLKTAKARNWRVRVHTRDGVLEGRVPLIDDTSAAIARRRVSFGAVAAVERMHHEGGGARGGAIAGGLLLGAAGAALSLLCDHNCGRVMLSMTTAGAVAGATIGGLTAQAVDPAVTRWERLWTAPAGVLAGGDTLIVPMPQTPALPPDNPTNFSTYVGGAYVNDGGFGPPLVPAAIGVMLSRDLKNVEVIMLDLHASRVFADGALGAMAGANLFSQRGYYIGATAGALVDNADDEVLPVAELAIGATDRSRSRVRLELTFQADLRRLEHTIGYFNLGYTIR